MNDTVTRTASDTLRVVAYFLAAHPDLPLPMVTIYSHRPESADLDWFFGNAADEKSDVAAIIKAVGGKWDKSPRDDRMDFKQERDGLRLNVSVGREVVCERIVVGTEEVKLPAVEAQPEHTEVRELVEWRCEPVLAEASA